MTTIRKKLIEHSLPLDAINAAAEAEKQIKVGKHTSIHQWFAPRPLATNRAVIFGQLVDDPSAWPTRFKTEEDQDRERRRLHGVIENMVEWPKSDAKDQSRFKSAIEAARWEIARSVAWGRGEEPPARADTKAVLAYLQEYAPPVYDPFCGGGSIPLEAQRLGLRAYGSDLNPIPVLITKALIEFPPKFAGLPPVHPAEPGKASLLTEQWSGARGLAEDVRYYGQWMRDEAEKKIGHLYPKATLPDGSQRPVIAWIWVRTISSPDPALNGAHVPLASSFILSKKKGSEAIVVPTRNEEAQDGWVAEVKSANVSADELAAAKNGTKASHGSNFTCVLSGASIDAEYVKREGQAGRLGQRMIALVADGGRKRVYLSPNSKQEAAAQLTKPDLPEIEQDLPNDPRNFWTVHYGLSQFIDLFTPRQLHALKTFSDLVLEVREKILEAAMRNKELASGSNFDLPLDEGGCGPRAYADAVAIYLACCVNRLTQCLSSLNRWRPDIQKIEAAFDKQSIPMVWDFGEANVFGSSTGSWEAANKYLPMSLERWGGKSFGEARLADAAELTLGFNAVVATDPPYYSNIAYADLSDYFYIWLRRSVGPAYRSLFRRTATPKSTEIVASPYRQGSKVDADQFFTHRMELALRNVSQQSDVKFPLTIYYAFQQSEISKDGLLSPGWAAFLQSVVTAGLQVDGTWPVRTEHSTRSVSQGTNALASSVVLVCRIRPNNAGSINRRDFLRELRPVMQQAILDHQKAGVPLPDRRQAAIGPGIGVFSKYAMVRESDDSPMSVATALAMINREIDAILAEGTEDLDAETRFALEWYQQFGYGLQKGKAGDAIQQLQGFNLDISSLNASGLFDARHGDAKLLSRGEMEDGWTPSKDTTFTLWEMAQHLARALTAEDGGLAKCGQLLAEKPTAAADVLLIAERMFEMATTRGENDEALVWNQLQTSWPGIETAADEANERGYSPAPEQSDLF